MESIDQCHSKAIRATQWLHRSLTCGVTDPKDHWATPLAGHQLSLVVRGLDQDSVSSLELLEHLHH